MAKRPAETSAIQALIRASPAVQAEKNGSEDLLSWLGNFQKSDKVLEQKKLYAEGSENSTISRMQNENRNVINDLHYSKIQDFDSFLQSVGV